MIGLWLSAAAGHTPRHQRRPLTQHLLRETFPSYDLMVNHLPNSSPSLIPVLILYRAAGTGISVRGYRNAASGRYQVALDDEVSIFDGRYASQTEQPVTLFYRTGLDPLTPHVLNVTNMDPRLLAISHVTLITVAGVP